MSRHFNGALFREKGRRDGKKEGGKERARGRERKRERKRNNAVSGHITSCQPEGLLFVSKISVDIISVHIENIVSGYSNPFSTGGLNIAPHSSRMHNNYIEFFA